MKAKYTKTPKIKKSFMFCISIRKFILREPNFMLVCRQITN